MSPNNMMSSQSCKEQATQLQSAARPPTARTASEDVGGYFSQEESQGNRERYSKVLDRPSASFYMPAKLSLSAPIQFC